MIELLKQPHVQGAIILLGGIVIGSLAQKFGVWGAIARGVKLKKEIQ